MKRGKFLLFAAAVLTALAFLTNLRAARYPAGLRELAAALCVLLPFCAVKTVQAARPAPQALRALPPKAGGGEPRRSPRTRPKAAQTGRAPPAGAPQQKRGRPDWRFPALLVSLLLCLGTIAAGIFAVASLLRTR